MEDNVILIEGKSIGLDPAADLTVGMVARQNGILIDQPCGGTGRCGKCGVWVGGVLSVPTDKDKDVLPERELTAGMRLACQTRALPGMIVTLRPDAGAQVQILESAAAGRRAALLPSAELGLAVDIGTTTIVVYAVERQSGTILLSASAVNPQISFGADVISRISYLESDSVGLAAMQDVLRDELNRMIAGVLAKLGATAAQVREIVVAGNSTMEHIFAGVSPACIGRAPFAPQFYVAPDIRAADVGIEVDGGVPLKLLPNISGFVGGDITAGIIFSGIAESEELSLLVDIGTNNEMVLGNADFLLCCSAAAGPAFEGANIGRGMRAAAGAIDSVGMENRDLRTTTIADAPARGICGSGLVDAVSVLLREGVIRPNGKFNRADEIANRTLAGRLSGTKASDMSFCLAGDVGLTQKDIREVQLAKGAISTGIELLLDEAGKSLGDIGRVCLAGAFGNYIDIDNAVDIGILPSIEIERITPCGNSAGLGACKAVNSQEFWDKAYEVIGRARNIELAARDDFQSRFVQNLSFREGYGR